MTSTASNAHIGVLTGSHVREHEHDRSQTKLELIGIDETEGRFAEVSIQRCALCSRVWLRYFVEYEAFSRSGRWARGEITQEQARQVTPGTALAVLENLPSYVRGGSYLNGVESEYRGAMHWGI